MTESKAEDQDLHYDSKQDKKLSETIYGKKKDSSGLSAFIITENDDLALQM